ncbi:hypothetical protein DM860_015786 [Cuscuta australis]|uniref:PCI domain-containing protein n=1 Tax=Cuscuta australis TaxID=267555 RepID=A0A328E1Y5_9ASTE|nr:hypothetical protein DM860_015786 [Cuscuta australis]
MGSYAKPENALKRAEEFINVGQKQEALQSLHSLITSRRYRAWQKPLERIMFKVVELCVDLRSGRFAKDALIQYRISCQQVNINSLEEVIKLFLHLATERAELARTQAQALEEALDVDDLEADKRPEDLMLSCVSGEKGKDRSDRELVTPWFKFLWETYRTVLEILRNNSRLEALYAMTAHRAFQFCKQYKRTTEFRRLCEIIRNHLANLNKYKDQRDRPDLSAPESLQLYLDTRFEQLKVATELCLWQVSKGVMTCTTQEVKDLYHVLENEFLPLDLALKAQPLLIKISKFGGKLMSASSVPEVQLSQYIPALEKYATLRLLQQASQVYHTIQIENLSRMVPFFDFTAVEKISVDAVKLNFVAIKIDHMRGAVYFGKQSIESEGLRDHLSALAESLRKARVMIYPPTEKAAKLGDAVIGLTEVVEKEHKRLLARKSIIEKRKEDQERLLLEKEREEELRRLKQQKITEEAEQRRLAAEFEERKNQRILREIQEREREEARAKLEESQKGTKKKGKKPILDGENITKQTVMEYVLSEQLRERQEMEKKLQKLAKTMDYLERAKREEAAPLIQAAFQQRLEEEAALHEREQQQEVELSKQRHTGDVLEKKRLSRMMENKRIFGARIISRRDAEQSRMKREREERINQIIQSRKQEREAKRKMIFFLRTEEERLSKLREEEEARKREEMEKRKKEEAERKAKLDEIAEKQRQRELELEEKERKRKEQLLGKSEPVARLPEAAPTAPAAAAPAPTNKYVPKFKQRMGEGASQAAAPAAPPPETERWGGSRQDDREKWGGGSRGGGWRDDRDRKPFGAGSRPGTWSSSRSRP